MKRGGASPFIPELLVFKEKHREEALPRTHQGTALD